MNVVTVCQSTCTPWATSDDLCSPCDGDYFFDSVLLEDCLQAASDVLFELSGQQYAGVCQDTVRPCPRYAVAGGGRPIRGSFGSDVMLGSSCGCGGTGPCGHGFGAVTLGVFPLNAVTEVKIDGVVIDPSLYTVADNRWLIRLAGPDGSNPGWPTTQRLDLPDTAEGTWSVTMVYGTPPPPMGVRAAARLGCELALMCSPETIGACQLPQGITSVARQGVDMVVLDPATIDRAILASLPECRIFLETYNPAKARRPSVVMSPDIGSRVTRISS